MNRYRKAYWIEIRSIQQGAVETEIHAEIKNDNIFVDAKNITGFTVTVPSQVDKNNASVFCNGTVFQIKGRSSLRIQIANVYVTEKENFNDEFRIYKGTGLIDVYLSPMRIVNCNIGNEYYDSVADAVQTPGVNTYDGMTNVKYPILSKDVFEKLMDESLGRYLLVIIDDITKPTGNLDKIRANIKFKLSRDGYEYNGRKVFGHYCIMQVTESPWNPQYSILRISTNYTELLNSISFSDK